jgi:hypothetical protein
MNLNVLYDLTNMPSTMMLAFSANELGFESVGPIINDSNEIIGNVWTNLENPESENFDELKTALDQLAENLTYEVV